MKRTHGRPLFLIPVLAFLAFVVFGVFAPSSIKLGNLGEWAAALAGFAAASTALYLAGDADRRLDRRETLARNRETWRRAGALGVELWVEVDRAMSGQLMSEIDQKRYQVAINLLMATAEHGIDNELADYSSFLCQAVWQPLVAVAEGTTSNGPSVIELKEGLSNRQDYLEAVNAVADMKSFDNSVSLEQLSIASTLAAADVGLNWDC